MSYAAEYFVVYVELNEQVVVIDIDKVDCVIVCVDSVSAGSSFEDVHASAAIEVIVAVTAKESVVAIAAE